MEQDLATTEVAVFIQHPADNKHKYTEKFITLHYFLFQMNHKEEYQH